MARVHIDDRNHDGRGRGRLGRRTALVTQAHPGEEVELRIDRQTRGTLQGRVIRLLGRDPLRISHDCRHEFQCTGCVFLAATPEEEAAFKLARLREILASCEVDADAVLEPIRTVNGPFGYRAYAKQVFARSREGAILGSYVTGTHEVTDNAGCPVLHPELADLLERVVAAARSRSLTIHDPPRREGLRYVTARRSLATGALQLCFVTSEDSGAEARVLAAELAARGGPALGTFAMVNREPGNVLLAGRPEHVTGPAFLEEELLGFRHRLGPEMFFQVNPEAAAALFGVAVEMAGSGAWCIEGYAGCGALTLPLTRGFSRVSAVERNPEAAAALRASAERNDAPVEVVPGAVADELGGLLATGTPDAIVLDPPRSGLGPEVRRLVAASQSPRVVILSCAPHSLAADLPPLLAAGYRVQRVVAVDQFPRTAHVETATALVRASG